MAHTVDLEAFVKAAKRELAALEADYAETARSYRGVKDSAADRRLTQLEGVREGIGEAKKAMNRALQSLLETK